MRKLSVLILALLFFSCSSDKDIQRTVYPNLFDGKYDSEFPYRSASEQLENISKTIRLVNSIAFYRTYYFEQNARMTMSAVRRGEHERYSSTSNTFEETKSGTGTIIYNSGKTVGVLSCSHIINFPDSIATYYLNDDGTSTGLIKNFSIVMQRSIYVVPFEGDGDFEVIIEDKDLDLVLLKKELVKPEPLKIRTFDFPIGNAKELEWGSFVYVFGFPINHKMISKAIVSSPNLDSKGSFLIDAIFNQGYSGGIVIAIRDGVPNFELVGMLRSVPADYNYVLRPHDEKEVVIGQDYNETPIVDSQINIKYGVTRILPIESILTFLNNNEDYLKSSGFYFDSFFR